MQKTLSGLPDDGFSGAMFAVPAMGILIGSVQRQRCSVAVLQPLGSSSPVAAGLQNPAFACGNICTSGRPPKLQI